MSSKNNAFHGFFKFLMPRQGWHIKHAWFFPINVAFFLKVNLYRRIGYSITSHDESKLVLMSFF